jgi:hypothetical protein
LVSLIKNNASQLIDNNRVSVYPFVPNTAAIRWVSLNGDLLAFARGTGWSVVEDVEAKRQLEY